MSRTEGYLADPEVQDRLRQAERVLQDRDAADLEALLRTESGRRLYHRLVFRMGNAASESFEPAIKDGICAALHTARNEGIRWVGRHLMQEAQELFPDLWMLALQEATTEAMKRLEERRAATRTQRNRE